MCYVNEYQLVLHPNTFLPPLSYSSPLSELPLRLHKSILIHWVVKAQKDIIILQEWYINQAQPQYNITYCTYIA